VNGEVHFVLRLPKGSEVLLREIVQARAPQLLSLVDSSPQILLSAAQLDALCEAAEAEFIWSGIDDGETVNERGLKLEDLIDACFDARHGEGRERKSEERAAQRRQRATRWKRRAAPVLAGLTVALAVAWLAVCFLTDDVLALILVGAGVLLFGLCWLNNRRDLRTNG
jgi:hypothetical protein